MDPQEEVPPQLDQEGDVSGSDEDSDGYHGPTFGSTLTDLLTGSVPNVQKPILANVEKKRKLDTDKNVRRKEKEHRKVKKVFLARDHTETPQFDDVERRLLRVATKGVVALYNAVNLQQRSLQQKQEEIKQTPIPETNATDSFISFLKSSTSSSSSSASSSSAASSSVPATQQSKAREIAASGSTAAGSWKILKADTQSSGKPNPVARADKPRARESVAASGSTDAGSWKILKDDYMMGAKLKDWDAQVADSEED